MKGKFFKITVIFMCIFSLTIFAPGCTKNGRENEQNNIKKKVAVIVKSTESEFFKSVYAGAEAAATEYNIELSFEGPKSEEDYETQNEMIRQAMEDQVDAIVFSAVDYEENAAAIDEAIKSGIKVVVIDSDVNSSNIKIKIGTDNYEAGVIAGKTLVKRQKACGEKLYVGLVNFDKNTENGQKRENGLLDAIEGESDIEVISKINVASNIESAKSGTINMLNHKKNINAIVTFNEWTSLGVGMAIEKTQKSDDVYVIGFDSNVVTVEMLETGEIDGLIVQNPYAMGYLGVENSYNLLVKNDVKSSVINTSTMLITQDNMYSDESQKMLFPFNEKE